MKGMKITSLDNQLDNIKERGMEGFVDSQMSLFNLFYNYNETSDAIIKNDPSARNNWAVAAYYLANKGTLTDKENEFVSSYYNYLLNNKGLSKDEHSVKILYLNKRLSKDFKPNQIGDSLDKGLQPVPEISTDDYLATFIGLLQETTNKDIMVQTTSTNRIRYNMEDKILFLPEHKLKSNFIDFYRSGCDYQTALNLVYDSLSEIHHAYKEDIRRNDISLDALIYSIEHAEFRKNNKTKDFDKQFKRLKKNVLANDKMSIDAAKDASKDIEGLINELASTMTDTNKVNYLNSLSNKYKSDAANMMHVIPDSKYFDTLNLDEDAFLKLFNLQFSTSRAVPKSNLTESLKLFATGGTLNTIYVLNENLSKLKTKMANEMDPIKKITLIEQYTKSKELTDIITNKLNTYAIEKEIMKASKSDCNDVDKITDQIGLVKDMAEDDYVSFKLCKQRLTNTYNSLCEAATSNSNSKAEDLDYKLTKLEDMMDVVDEVENELNENSKDYVSEPMKINAITDFAAATVAIQNIMGCGFGQARSIVRKMKETKEFNVNTHFEGWDKFVKDSLQSSGVDFVKEDKKLKNK